VDALTPEAAQAWLENLVATAPIEVAVVGDLSRERANALVQTYLGSLPNRARVGPGYMAEARRIKRAPGMVQTRTEVDTKTPVAVVVGGFFGPDASNVRDTRLMNLALNTLNTRMNKVIREERQLVYSISAIFRPGEAFPGYGVVLAPAPTEPSKVPALSAAVFEVIDALMKEGPTEEELGVAKKQMANTLDEQFKEPGFWSGRLANLTYRGQSLDDVTGGPASYAALTAAEVKSTFGAYAKPEARFSIAVAPKGEGAAPAAAPAPAPGK
jgi:zinc protease